jgi:hypothetical protein
LGGVEDTTDGVGISAEWRHPFAAGFRRNCDLTAPPGAGADRRWNDATPSEATRALIERTYLNPKAAWRRIDGDWLAAAEELALNLDSDTNNTSLVLAFEWGAPGKGVVLLFAGDAQVGNWLSWWDQKYGDRKLTADDLLSREVLYKVGYHGSHNATVCRDPRDQSSGAPFELESMNGIIAMVPVDWDAAQKKMPDPWRMPHEPLYRRLREKAQRRVLRSDRVVTPLDAKTDGTDVTPSSPEWQPVPGLKGARWRMSKETFNGWTQGPPYYDVAISLPQ